MKEDFCALSWLIAKIILRCTVSKTSKNSDLSYVTSTDSRRETDKWPALVKVIRSHDVANTHQVTNVCHIYQSSEGDLSLKQHAHR